LLNINDTQKTTQTGLVKAVYQYSLTVKFNDNETGDVIPYTFEDALVFSNIEIFKKLTGQKGLIKKMQDAVNKESLSEASEAMFKALEKGKKAEMALELLFIDDTLTPPKYISEGLIWIQSKLKTETENVTCTSTSGS
jgi:hypothetical protein